MISKSEYCVLLSIAVLLILHSIQRLTTSGRNLLISIAEQEC